MILTNLSRKEHANTSFSIPCSRLSSSTLSNHQYKSNISRRFSLNILYFTKKNIYQISFSLITNFQRKIWTLESKGRRLGHWKGRVDWAELSPPGATKPNQTKPLTFRTRTKQRVKNIKRRKQHDHNSKYWNIHAVWKLQKMQLTWMCWFKSHTFTPYHTIPQ